MPKYLCTEVIVWSSTADRVVWLTEPLCPTLHLTGCPSLCHAAEKVQDTPPPPQVSSPWIGLCSVLGGFSMTTAYVFKKFLPLSQTYVFMAAFSRDQSLSLCRVLSILVCNPNQWLHKRLEFLVFLCNISLLWQLVASPPLRVWAF